MKIVILGAGPAGIAAAYYLKQKGFNDITIIEKESYIGGCCYTRFYDGIPYEFGPQVLFTNKDYLIDEFNKFLTKYEPPSPDKEYHYFSSINGNLDELHDFPVTTKNVLAFKNAGEIIYELYNINLDKPDYSNFENYCISRIGKTLYETYIKNYNKKAWGINPEEMDTDWVKYRPITLQAENTRFQGQWQGHPGNYNVMWDKMTSGINIVKAEVSLKDNYKYYANDTEIQADIIITTLPLSNQLEFMDTFKVFVVLKSEEFVCKSAFTTFPNNYSFVRLFEYKQQFYVESEYTLLDFVVPYKNKLDETEKINEILNFCKNILNKEVVEYWIDDRKKIYPLATRKNINLFNNCLEDISNKNIIPVGRAGLHAYISKDTCIRMGMELADNFDKLIDSRTKLDSIKSLRRDLH